MWSQACCEMDCWWQPDFGAGIPRTKEPEVGPMIEVRPKVRIQIRKTRIKEQKLETWSQTGRGSHIRLGRDKALLVQMKGPSSPVSSSRYLSFLLTANPAFSSLVSVLPL